MPKKVAQDLTGKTFNRLKVLKLVEVKKGNYFWLCRCDCGGTIVTRTGNLNNGMTQSCGCIKKEMMAKRNGTHGMSETPINNVWSSIKQRCLNPNEKSYVNYGGRGIKICDKWLTFEGFYEDMGESYKHGLTIERIDNNGDYCKENCCWADRFIQANNNRRSRIETFNGVTDTLSNLCRRFGFPNSTIKRRLERGWSIERSFSTPRKEPK